MRKVFLEILSFISIRYVTCFLSKAQQSYYYTHILSSVITEKNLYLKLLVTNQIFFWVGNYVSLDPEFFLP